MAAPDFSTQVEFPAEAAVSHVTTAFNWLGALASEWTNAAHSAVVTLSGWAPPEEWDPPNLHLSPIQADSLPAGGQPNAQLFGEIDDLDPGEFDSDILGLLDSFTPEDVDAFAPVGPVPAFGVDEYTPRPAPEPYEPQDVDAPDDAGDLTPPPTPQLVDIAEPSFPPAPPFTPLDITGMPPNPDFLELQLPDPEDLIIPPLDDGTIPTFDLEPLDLAAITYTAGSYDVQVKDEVAATVKLMLAGDFAMPAAVQDALWGAAVDRENIAARRTIDAAVSEWAGRGFFMPPGMLNEQVAAIRDDAALRANGHSREVFAQAAGWAIENLRTAVAQGIALEGMWSQHWNQIENRALEACRLQVDVIKEHFNLQVLAYNTKLARIGMLRDLFIARWEAEKAKLEQWRGHLEFELAKGQVNEQELRLFLGKIQAITDREKFKGDANRLELEKYLGEIKAQIDVTSLKATINDARLKAYLGELERIKTLATVFAERIRAAGMRVDMEKARLESSKQAIDAWEKEISAHVALRGQDVQLDLGKIQFRETEARAWAAMVSAVKSKDEAALRYAQTKASLVGAATQKYSALLGGQEARIRAQVAAIQGRASAYSADMQRIVEEHRYHALGEEMKIRAAEATQRNNIAYFDVVARQFDARMTRLLSASQQVVNAIQAAGQMASQMAAGAMSAVHASASVGGTGSYSSQSSWSRNENFNH